MNITERAHHVLTEIDAALAMAEKATPGPWHTGNERLENTNFVYRTLGQNMARGFSINVLGTVDNQDKADAAFIAASRNGWPLSLRCLKTAIEGLLKARKAYMLLTGAVAFHAVDEVIITLCETWESSR